MDFDTEKVTVTVDGNGVNIKKKDPKNKKRQFLDLIGDTVIQPICLGVAVIIYVSISLGFPDLLAPSGLSPWGYLWPIFFLCPFIAGTYKAIVGKKLALFPIWAGVLFAYLFGGMYAELWHPFWVEFFLIPGFYSIVVPIDRGIREYHRYKEDNPSDD